MHLSELVKGSELIEKPDIATWEPQRYDFAIGRALMIAEDYSKCVTVNHVENLHFTVLLYSILSHRETFDKHKKQFNDFLIADLNTADKILANKEAAEKILEKYGFSSHKKKAVISIAENWNRLDITNKMKRDKKKKKGFEIREELVENMHGVGYKFASLFIRMSGYENIVPVDTWAIQYVESRGFVNRSEKSGLTPKQYLAYEKKIIAYAKKFGVSPALFQATIYAKFSTWGKNSGLFTQFP